MDLVYEAAGGKLSDSQETLQPTTTDSEGSNATPTIDAKTAEINRKTEEGFEKLEAEISKTYTAIESRASTWGASLSSWMNTNLKVADVINETKKQMENLHLDQKFTETTSVITKNIDTLQKKVMNEETTTKSKNMLSLLTTKTNTYLDTLDKDLEQVESVAGQYASKFGQFLKDTISVSAADADYDDELIDDEVANVLFNVKDHKTGLKVSASRTEAQLHTLHTSPELYLTEDTDPKFDEFKSTFKIESKTEEISTLLQETPTLQRLSTELVPAKVKYDEFWARYFFMKDKIYQQESTRKRLLGQHLKPQNEDLSWGDDEEDEEEEESKENAKMSSTSSDGTYELNSVSSSTVEVNKKKKQAKPAEEEDDDDDDDWE